MRPCECAASVFAASVVALAIAATAAATEIRVDHAGGGDYNTIQEGINASVSGDTVWVAQGTYTGPLNREISFGGRNILLRAEQGPNLTTINCMGEGRAFYLNGGENSSCIIRGFTIINGRGEFGGGMYLVGSSPTVTDCRFSYNVAFGNTWGGGAIACRDDASPAITNVTFFENTGDFGGALFSAQGSSPTVTNCAFIDNVAEERGGGWYCEQPGRVAITGCTFVGNSVTAGNGGGMYLFEASPTITNVTFALNAANNAGGIWCWDSSPTIEHTIIAFSQAGDAVSCGGTSDPSITECVVFGNEGGDDLCGSVGETLHVDPRFCDMVNNFLTHCSNSHCLSANNGWTADIGAAAVVGCGDCLSPVEQTTWGRLKAFYR
jgi:predicted outer membrane repeat protein